MKVDYIHHCGSDLAVVNAARVSFDKESKGVEEWILDPNPESRAYGLKLNPTKGDKKLIKYLATHDHHSPFNHSFITMRVKAPIFVARQLVKHKFMVFNEVSRRYVTKTPEFFIPDVWRMKHDDKKQGSSDVAIEIDSVYRRVHGTRPDQSITNRKLTNWRNGAKRKGKEFNLSHEDIPWTTHCPFLDIELDYSVKGHGNSQDNSPSLDRIDNSKGYVKGNVQVISKLANSMKNSATPEQIRTFVKNIGSSYGVFTRGSNSVEDYYETQLDLYKRSIDAGMCPEQARMFLPQSLMTEWYWSGTLGAWLDMLKLRLKDNTQQETREIAEQCADIIAGLFPVSYETVMGELK